MSKFLVDIQCEEIYLAEFDSGEMELLCKENFEMAKIEQGAPLWAERIAA